MSNYPLSIDTQLVIVTDTTPINPNIHNELRDSILAIQNELGIKPSGIYGTVRERLNALDSRIDSIVSGGGGGVQIGGDLGGTVSMPKVIGLQGRVLSATAPTLGNALVWGGVSWLPGTPNVGAGAVNSVQFNNNGLLGGAAHTSISSDGYLQIANDRSGGAATIGDLRFPKLATSYIRNTTNTSNMTLFRAALGQSNIEYLTIGSDNFTYRNSNTFDDVEIYANKYVGFGTKNSIPTQPYCSILGLISPGIYHADTTASGIFMVPNVIIGGMQTNIIPYTGSGPFRDGYGIIVIQDRVGATTSPPIGGFDLWSDPSTHHPTIQLPNGITYDLIASNAPSGNNKSLQFNNSGVFAGASHASISSDGYLQISNDKLGGSATKGDIRFSSNSAIYGRSIDGINDVPLFSWQSNDILSIGARNYATEAKSFATSIYGEHFVQVVTSNTPGEGFIAGLLVAGPNPNDTVPNLPVRFAASYPNFWFANSSNTSPLSADPFSGGRGYLLVSDYGTIATGNPSNGFWLWSDPTTHHPNIKLPSGLSYDLVATNNVSGNNKSVQFNNFGAAGGADHVSIATDGYLQLSNDRSGGSAATGDLRLSDNFLINSKSSTDGYDKAVLTTFGNILSIGANTLSFVNDGSVMGATHVRSKYVTTLTAGFISTQVGAISGNPSFATPAARSSNFTYAYPNFWINQPTDIFTGNLTYNPFGDGYGYMLMSDLATPATGNPTRGFWMWSDPSTHHPTVQLPNGSSYDLISSNAPVGNDRSLQFNNAGVFGGSAHTSISSDGYLQINTDGYGGSPSIGELRFGAKSRATIRDASNTKDLTIFQHAYFPDFNQNTLNIGSHGSITDVFEQVNITSIYSAGLLAGGNTGNISGEIFVNVIGPNPYYSGGGANVKMVEIGPNILFAPGSYTTIGNLTFDPFAGGEGMMFVADQAVAESGNPIGGYWLSANPVNHHPKVKLPNGSVYDLTDGYPGGALNSIQFNNGFNLGGASHASISSDGYLQLRNDGYGGSAQSGDIRLAQGALINVRSADTTKDLTIIQAYNGNNLAVFGGSIAAPNTVMDQTYILGKNSVNIYLPDPTTGAATSAFSLFKYSGVSTGSFALFQNTNFVFNGANVSTGISALGSGSGVLYIGNATTNPSTNPTGGNILYSDTSDGYLKYRRTDGLVIPLDGIGTNVIATPTGTGFPHITSGSQDSAAKLVVDADVNASAAIAGTKISPNFGSQLVTTTGNIRADGYIGAGNGNYPAIGSFRVPGNSTNVDILTVRHGASTDHSVVRYESAAALVRLGASGISLSTAINLGAITYLGASGTSTTIITNSLTTMSVPLALGAGTFASSGSIRFPNFTGSIMTQRNSANTADLVAMSFGVADLIIGATTGLASAFTNTYIAGTSTVQITNGSTTVANFGASLTTTPNPIAIGTTPATSGLLRIPYNGAALQDIIKARNSANSGDIPIISTNAASTSFGDYNNGNTTTVYGSSTNLTYSSSASIGNGTFTAIRAFASGMQFFSTGANLGGGSGVLGIANATTNPTTNPTGGLVAYVDAADGYFKTRTRDGYVVALNGAGTGGSGIFSGDVSVGGTIGGNAAPFKLRTAAIVFASADITLTNSQAECPRLKVSGSGGSVNIIAPDIESSYFIVDCSTSGLSPYIHKVGGSPGTGVVCPSSKITTVLHNGTDYHMVSQSL